MKKFILFLLSFLIISESFGFNEIKKDATPVIFVMMVDSTDGYTPETGVTAPTVYYSKAGGAATSVSPTWAETDATNMAGVYELTLTAAMTDTQGELTVYVSKAGSRNFVKLLNVVDNIESDTYGKVDTEIATIDTEIGVIDGIVDAILLDTGTTLDGLITTIDTVVDAIKAVTDQMVFTVANLLNVNALAISSDTTSADNLELQYDGTGIIGDTYPATQAGLGAIGAGSGGGLSFETEADNVSGAIKTVTFVGVQTSGTYVSTEAEDGTYHNITHTGNAIDIIYQFDIGGARTCSDIVFKGYLSSSNDTIQVQLYDFVGSDWETRGTIVGQGGTTNINQTFTALSKHTGTSGADIGLTLIRFICSAQTSPDFFIDELIATGVSEGQSVGYAMGRVWVDTVDGIAGTESFVNGVADNPVLTFADAITIAGNVLLHKYSISNESTITLASTLSNAELYGSGWVLDLNGQDISNSYFEGVQSMTGIGTASTGEVHFIECEFNGVTIGNAHLKKCGLGGALTLSDASDYYLQNCYSQVAGGGTPSIDFGVAVGNTNLSMRSYSGGIEIKNYNATGTDTMSLEGNGQLIINANCTGGSISVRGNFKVTDNSGGAVTIVYDDNTQNLADVLVDTGTTLDGKIDTIDGIVDTILLDTGELQTDLVNGGRLDLILDSILADTDILQSEWADGGRLDLILDGASAPTVAQIRAEIDSNSTQLALIVADTNELQTDWADGGRLDLILDSASAPTVGQIADAVWDELIAPHLGAGSTGQALNAAGGAGDPWNTTLPGTYTGSQAGKMLSDISTTQGTDSADITSIKTRVDALNP